MTRVPPGLRDRVREQAGARCEYCRLPEQASSMPFESDHIIPEHHGGKTGFGNLAWSCFACNRHRISNLSGIDRKTHRRTWLFNPRRQKWDRHFRWDRALLVGRTPVGRTTIMVLAINLTHRVEQRMALIAEGVFFPC